MRSRALLAFCATTLSISAIAQTVDVPATQVWTDTNIDLRAGDNLTISADGTLQLPQAKSCGPAGANRGFRDLLKAYPVNEAGLGALIGRIGSSDAAQPFLVGASKEIQIRRAGRLFLGINSTNESLDGYYKTKVVFVKRGPEKPVTPQNLKLPTITLDMIDRIPRRVADSDGNPGDNTNFLIVGSEKDVIDTFKDAGWVKVDKDSRGAVFTALLETLNKQSYVEMPMSILTLYGRPQDYGLAHAEPIAVVAQRHHLRLCKIDPDIDLEREYVSHSLDETGLVAKMMYVMPSHPSKEAVTATGASFHSDGRMLIRVPDGRQLAWAYTMYAQVTIDVHLKLWK